MGYQKEARETKKWIIELKSSSKIPTTTSKRPSKNTAKKCEQEWTRLLEQLEAIPCSTAPRQEAHRIHSSSDPTLLKKPTTFSVTQEAFLTQTIVAPRHPSAL